MKTQEYEERIRLLEEELKDERSVRKEMVKGMKRIAERLENEEWKETLDKLDIAAYTTIELDKKTIEGLNELHPEGTLNEKIKALVGSLK